MAEYIEREAVVKYLRSRQSEFIDDYGKGWSNGVGSSAQICEKFPAADVTQVVHGRWELNKDGSGTCNQCNRTQVAVWDFDTWQNFCGHCGARMDQEE